MVHDQPVRPYPFGPTDRLTLDPLFAELREREPVSRISPPYGGEVWLVTRYDDARRALSDARLSRAAAVGPDVPRMTPEPGGAASILLTDPPDHTRLRGLVAKAFTSRQIGLIRAQVRALANDLLDHIVDLKPPVDLVEHLAVPQPVRIICGMLGVPHEDRYRFRGWIEAIMSSTAYPAEQVRAALDEFTDYIVDLIDQRRAHPTEDLLGVLVQAHDIEDRLSEQELVTFIGVLLVAGHENTANQITNFAYTLMTEPGLLDYICGQPKILPMVIEELLR